MTTKTVQDWLDRIKPVDNGTPEARAYWLGQEIAMILVDDPRMDPVFKALKGIERVRMGNCVQLAAAQVLEPLLREWMERDPS